MRKLSQALFMALLLASSASVYAAGPEEGSEVVVTTGDETTEPTRLFQDDEDNKPKA